MNLDATNYVHTFHCVVWHKFTIYIHSFQNFKSTCLQQNTKVCCWLSLLLYEIRLFLVRMQILAKFFFNYHLTSKMRLNVCKALTKEENAGCQIYIETMQPISSCQLDQDAPLQQISWQRENSPAFD